PYGIQWNFQEPPQEIFITGFSQQISQAFCKLFQSLISELSPEERQNMAIDLDVKEDSPSTVSILISAPLSSFQSQFGAQLHLSLGLSMAHRIFASHRGILELSSQTSQKITAKISFQRPDFKSQSQVFDGEI
ncbi:MAG: hypothetical protein D6797_05490, partial [Bdellovibrio sp.]